MTDVDSPAWHRTAEWYKENDWELFEFQQDTWRAWHAGESGLVHSPTGSGKTLAAWMGPLQAALSDGASSGHTEVLWLTPLRALAADTRENLAAAAKGMGLDVQIEVRSGDTSSAQRARQKKSPPFALITTPESLSVMLAESAADKRLKHIHTVVVDEWHELLGSKRGVQLQLGLARVKKYSPMLRIWGLSATLANLDVAMQALLGAGRAGTLIRGVVPRDVVVESLIPAPQSRFPWAGHLGLQLAPLVGKELDKADTTLIFTNTRSQAELWFQALAKARPDLHSKMALHHGSIDRELRTDIENRLRSGDLKAVVCTSSLDLGVDFSPVDRVLQVGSPKGVARLMQRAGRSGHRPGAVSRILCVPANTFELVEIAAVRKALAENRVEGRQPPERSLDVLCQHLVTIALGNGFVTDDIIAEIRSTYTYQHLSDAEWDWVMEFITSGGHALKAYPQYHKVVEVAGVHRVMNEQIGQRHRMSIGTIASDTQISVAFMGGRRIGHTEENFISRLNPGDVFQFAGKNLELIRIKDMTAYVRNAKKKSRFVPRWWGTQLPLSTELADSVLETLEAWQNGSMTSPELDAIGDVLKLQQQWSHLPGSGDFLIEYTETREGHSLFCYPFAGRLAHEGLAMVIASRLSATMPITFTLQINDYGFELQSPSALDISIDLLRPAFATENLLDDILVAINSGEIAKRRFRDIARIAGLVFDGYPGRSKSTRQVQASSGLIYEVLENYDTDNLLLDQARREVLELQLEYQRLADTLDAIGSREWILTTPKNLTPLAFPLWAESLQSQTISSESFQNRVKRMLGQLEDAAEETLGN